jgi:two-component system NtrC family response regulator
MNVEIEPSDGLAQMIIGMSAPVRRVRSLIRRVAPTSLPVLVLGPTGSGKELVAAALHAGSGRSGAFVAQNVCALSDAMFEDAMFGHVRGSFTGAAGDTAGFLVEADNGTIFLDEISSLALASQVKLLRALETHTFRPVGASRDRRSSFRSVAASNEDLQLLCREGKFRPDLYHRLAGVTIRVPSLDERREDVPLLAHAFLTAAAPGARFAEDAMALLTTLDWPGNVRQLRNVVDAAVTFAARGVVEAEDVHAATGARTSIDSSLPTRAASLARQLFGALVAADWNVPMVADELGVHKTTVYRRIARLRREDPSFWGRHAIDDRL